MPLTTVSPASVAPEVETGGAPATTTTTGSNAPKSRRHDISGIDFGPKTVTRNTLASHIGKAASTGWTAGSISPQVASSSPAIVGQILGDPRLASAGQVANTYNTAPAAVQQQISASSSTAPPTRAGTSNIGWLNWIAQNPVTADQLLLPAQSLQDPKLGQMTSYTSPLVGARRTEAQVSLFNDPNAPASIMQQIQSLNMNQSLRRAQQAEYINRLFGAAVESPVYAEALRAASIQPGASAAFGARILSNPEMAANVTGAQASAQNIAARTAAINAVDTRQRQLQQLQQQRASLGQNPMGFYTGSQQEKLDKQIMALESDIRNNQGTQRIAESAAGTSSGWVPIR